MIGTALFVAGVILIVMFIFGVIGSILGITSPPPRQKGGWLLLLLVLIWIWWDHN